VLARLPDVSAELLRERPAAGRVGYRFDPPESAERGSRTGEADVSRVPLRQALIYSPQATRPSQPHVFERGRTADRAVRFPRRKSPILPRSNPFALPRQRMFDSIAPVLRFLTLFALFTVAATWFQVARERNQATSKPAEPGTTTAQEPAAPAAKTADRPAKAPTSAGPVSTTPEAGTRVGRVRENEDFASLRGDILPVIPMQGGASETMPSLAGANGGALPRLQTTEVEKAEVAIDPAGTETSTPEVASLPGFFIEIPSR
jgi:hypothetical protein